MNIEKIWNRIKQNEGNLFYTITGKEYRYVVYNDFLLIDDRKDRRVTKEAIAKAMMSSVIKRCYICAKHNGFKACATVEHSC